MLNIRLLTVSILLASPAAADPCCIVNRPAMVMATSSSLLLPEHPVVDCRASSCDIDLPPQWEGLDWTIGALCRPLSAADDCDPAQVEAVEDSDPTAKRIGCCNCAEPDPGDPGCAPCEEGEVRDVDCFPCTVVAICGRCNPQGTPPTAEVFVFCPPTQTQAAVSPQLPVETLAVWRQDQDLKARY